MAVHTGDDIAALQSGLLGWAAGLDSLDHYSVWGTKGFEGNWVGADFLLEADANRTARHATLPDDLVVNFNRHGGRKRKANTLIPTAAGDDGRVDSNHLAGKVDERAAGVTWIDGRVGLQESLELLADAAAVLGADDARRYRGLQPEGAANRQNPIANLHAVRIAQLRDGQLFVGVNLDHSQVRFFVHTHNLRGVSRGVGVQLHLNLCSLLDDVIVGEDVAALVHDDARAETAFGLRLWILATVEEAVEEVLHRIILVIRLGTAFARLLALQHLRGGDIDHRGLDLVHDARKSI